MVCRCVYWCIYKSMRVPFDGLLVRRHQSASYGWLKHLLTSHVHWVSSYFQKLSANVLTLLTQAILSEAKGLVFVIPFWLILPVRVLPKPSLCPYCVQLSCQRWRRYCSREINASVHSYILPAPLTMMLFIAVWLFCVHSDSYMSTLTVPSCLQEVRHSVSSLLHLHTTHTHRHVHTPTCSALPFIAYPFLFSLFLVRGSRLGRRALWCTITSMCHLFSWVLQYYLTLGHSQIWSWNTTSASSQLEVQTYSLDHMYYMVYCFFHFPKK